jgi:inosose dehydratase
MAYVGRFSGSNAKHASPAMAAASGYAVSSEELTSLPTSTKWSVLSSRVEGLVAELSQVVGNMDSYCVSKSNAEGAAMAAVRAKMLSTPWAEEWAEKRTMFSYGEEMSTDPLEAMLLKELVALGKPQNVLEIGMFVGYGAVALLEGCPRTKVVSLEIDPYLKGWLSSCLHDFPEISRRHDIVLGPALESLPKLTGSFDMVFIDANKAEYMDYVKVILEKNLLAEGGMIVCDNILYNGYPYTSNHFDAQPARRGFGDAVKDFNQWVYDQPELEQIVLPIRDGVSMIRRRQPKQAAPAATQGQWLKLSGHPCSWGVDYADHPSNPAWDKVISLMSVAGYTGTDLGPVGYYDTERLGDMLKGLKLDLVAGNIFEKMHEPDQLEMIIEKTKTSCSTLAKFGAKFFVIVPHTVPEKEATAGRPNDAPRLSDDKWAQMISAIKEVAKVVQSYGICCMLHPHAGSWIEYEDEMERALQDLPADLVSLCLDTGHCTYAGMDAVEKFKKHSARIPYMQLKDIDPAVLKKMQETKGSFWDGVTAGIFCILGQGSVDYPALLRAMKESGFSGYATIEQDFDNKIDDQERKLMYPATCSMQSVAYLRKLADSM